MNNEIKRSFDDRIVKYEYIHGNQEQDFQNLITAINPKDTDIILDACAGYMDVTKYILDQFSKTGNKPQIYALDDSLGQINLAKEKQLIPNNYIIHADITNTPFTENMFDTVVVKMGMHEIPLEKQKLAFQECCRILKPGGKLVIWELALPNTEIQKVFQSIVHEKDRLCGFDSLVENRYFQQKSELHELFNQAGFKIVTEEFPIKATLSMERRLSEFVSKDRLEIIRTKGEIEHEDENLLNQFAYERLKKMCEYIRGHVPEHLKEELKLKDTGSNIEFTVDKIIMSGKK